MSLPLSEAPRAHSDYKTVCWKDLLMHKVGVKMVLLIWITVVLFSHTGERS